MTNIVMKKRKTSLFLIGEVPCSAKLFIVNVFISMEVGTKVAYY